MNILDAVIIILLILGIMGGFRRGFVKETVLLIGLIAVIVISYYLKNPVATFLYKHLPFLNFNGIFKGVTILNILLYEVIAFILVFSILYLILRLLLKISGLIESLLKATIILGFFSKIAGGIVGFIESYIIVFIILFIFNQPFIRVTGIEESKVANFMLNHTIIMSSTVENTNKVVKEIYDLSKVYKNDSKEFNKQAIELFIKYEIISEENLNYLREKGKIE
jgi:uncharacterized membrane protein required for colicin V production